MDIKSVEVRARLHPSEKTAIRKLAQDNRVTVSEWIRQQIRAASEQTQAAA